MGENGHNTGCQCNKRNYRDYIDKNVHQRNARTVEFSVKLILNIKDKYWTQTTGPQAYKVQLNKKDENESVS